MMIDASPFSICCFRPVCVGAAATSFPASVSLSLVDPPATSFVPRLVHLFMLDLVLLLFFSFVWKKTFFVHMVAAGGMVCTGEAEGRVGVRGGGGLKQPQPPTTTRPRLSLYLSPSLYVSALKAACVVVLLISVVPRY